MALEEGVSPTHVALSKSILLFKKHRERERESERERKRERHTHTLTERRGFRLHMYR